MWCCPTRNYIKTYVLCAVWKLKSIKINWSLPFAWNIAIKRNIYVKENATTTRKNRHNINLIHIIWCSYIHTFIYSAAIMCRMWNVCESQQQVFIRQLYKSFSFLFASYHKQTLSYINYVTFAYWISCSAKYMSHEV